MSLFLEAEIRSFFIFSRITKLLWREPACR